MGKVRVLQYCTARGWSPWAKARRGREAQRAPHRAGDGPVLHVHAGCGCIRVLGTCIDVRCTRDLICFVRVPYRGSTATRHGQHPSSNSPARGALWQLRPAAAGAIE